MYDSLAAERLIATLVAAFGPEPQWELLPDWTYSYYLNYNAAEIPMGEIRAVIDATFNSDRGVILAPRGYDRSWAAPHRTGRHPTVVLRLIRHTVTPVDALHRP